MTAAATSPAVPNEALADAIAAYGGGRARGLSNIECLRVALLAATPHILDANPDTDAYQRGHAAGIHEATDLIEATT